ncbi:MAG: hypothetical protein CMJ86_07190 [Planctomycetes bacterium]|nr:hypothetical protein [Planctomycetota bacterium]
MLAGFRAILWVSVLWAFTAEAASFPAFPGFVRAHRHLGIALRRGWESESEEGLGRCLIRCGRSGQRSAGLLVVVFAFGAVLDRLPPVFALARPCLERPQCVAAATCCLALTL